MRDRSLLVIVLAAGLGTRMKSKTPKVLHKVAGRTMLGHVLHGAMMLGADKLAVVTGPEGVEIEAVTRATFPDAEIFVQKDRLGTAHAVLAARPAIAAHDGDVLVLSTHVNMVITLDPDHH